MEYFTNEVRKVRENFQRLDAYFFSNQYLAVPWPTLGHSRGGSLPNLMLITVIVQFQLEGHQEPCNEVGPQRLVEHLVGFKPGTFRF